MSLKVYTFVFNDGKSEDADSQEEIIHATSEVNALTQFTEKYPVQNYPELQIEYINTPE